MTREEEQARLAAIDERLDDGELATVEDWQFILDGLTREGLVSKGPDDRYRLTEFGKAQVRLPQYPNTLQ